MFEKLFGLTDGKKTYIVGTLMIVYALLGLALGDMESARVVELVLGGLGLFGLRHGIAKN